MSLLELFFQNFDFIAIFAGLIILLVVSIAKGTVVAPSLMPGIAAIVMAALAIFGGAAIMPLGRLSQDPVWWFMMVVCLVFAPLFIRLGVIGRNADSTGLGVTVFFLGAVFAAPLSFPLYCVMLMAGAFSSCLYYMLFIIEQRRSPPMPRGESPEGEVPMPRPVLPEQRRVDRRI